MKRLAILTLFLASTLCGASKPMIVEVHVGGGGPSLATVTGAFEISKEGTTGNIRISSSPHEKLSLVSKRAIAQWRFPIVSSPIVMYQMSSGFTLRVSLVGGRFSFYGGIGSDASLWLLGNHPWGFGVNLLALAAVGYAVRIIGKQSQAAEPGATDNPDDAQRLREDN